MTTGSFHSDFDILYARLHPLQHPVYYPLLRHRPVVGSTQSQRMLQTVLAVVSGYW